jgi:nucleotide-binding universal stress UspA family protein
MTALRTVAAAVDFSAGSVAALARAADLARRAGAALHVVHADVLFQSSGDGAPPSSTSGGTLRLRLERAARDAGASGATMAVARDVKAVAGITRYAAEVEADLLVIGTHGRTGVARLLLGSVAEACVAAAPCPVLTVPRTPGATEPSPEAAVLVAVDFSDRSRAAIAAGGRLAALFGAELELVHVVRDAGPYPGLAPNILSLVDYDPAQGEAIRDRLERFADTIPDATPTALHVGLGEPSRVVTALAAERGAGALVLGTHGRTGLAHALIGSVAEAALRRSPCPVLTLRQPHRLGRVAPSLALVS